jgi:hypothetical protein
VAISSSPQELFQRWSGGVSSQLIFARHTCSDRAGAGSEGIICEGEKRVIKAKMLAKNMYLSSK